MTNIYCDYATGNDSTGSGTTGAPYKTIQKCMNVANGGDTINIANTSAQILTSSISWIGGFAGVSSPSAAAPLIIQAWNNGGSITISHPAGNFVAAEIDGNAAVASIFGSTGIPTNVVLKNLKMHHTTSTVVVANALAWVFYRCEIYDGSTALLSSTSTITAIESVFHDANSGADGLKLTATASHVIGCYFYNIPGTAVNYGGTDGIIRDCLIVACGTGVNCKTRSMVLNNTIVGDGRASQIGLNIATGNQRVVCLGNIVTDHSGTGSIAVDMVSTGNFSTYGYNSYYNNTANFSGGFSILGIDLSAFDISETSSPYVAAGSGNYALVSTALSKANAFPRGLTGSGTLSYVDAGAAQRQESALAVSRALAYGV